MNKFYCRFLLLILFVNAFAFAQQTVRIGLDATHPPFSSLDEEGELIGFDVDLVNAICEHLSLSCEIINTEPKQIVADLLASKLDVAVSFLLVSPAEKSQLIFSNSYYNGAARFMKSTSSNITFSPGAFKGKRVGIEEGSVHATYLQTNYADQVELVKFATLEEAVDAMQVGEVDLIFSNQLILEYSYVNDKAYRMEFFGPAINSAQFLESSNRFFFHKGKEDLARQFSQAIRQLRTKGTYQTISKEYFGKDIHH